ncbi:hypothetical protein [Actinomadura sp. CNU-125]|uniref:hypothetical protein n=1 Tax=Actinomadura sp. CNU-125 TaxID=1904961 RepID=UPI0021CD17CB|nr:hypothetical protein [Actinomadura sp. CNU-125]
MSELAMAVFAPDAPWWRLAPGLAVAGVASGLTNAMLARLAVDSVPADRASMGSGANNTARYIGASVGVAIVGTVATGSGHDPSALAHGTNVALVVSAVAALAYAALALAIRER